MGEDGMDEMDNLQNEETDLKSGEIEVPVKKSEKRRLLIIAAVVAVIALVIGIVFLSTGNSKERLLQKQLDLGAKYIDELNYEQALVSFTAAIEIDPLCAEAYIGAADAYVGMEDYEGAIAILQEGINVLLDAGDEDEAEKLQKELDSIIKISDAQAADEEVSAALTTEVENASEYITDEAFINAIVPIISTCENGSYQEAANMLITDEFIDRFINVSEGTREFKGIYDDNIIYVKQDNDTFFHFICLPENGMGFIITRYYDEGHTVYGVPEGEVIVSDDDWGYLVCPVENYKFNGSFYSYFLSDSEGYPDDRDATQETNGNIKDNFFDGEIETLYTYTESGDAALRYYQYADGYPISYGDYDDEYVIISKVIDLQYGDGEEIGGRERKEDYEERSKNRYGPISAMWDVYFTNTAPYER